MKPSSVEPVKQSPRGSSNRGLLRKGWEGHLQDFLKHLRVKLGPVLRFYHQVGAADVLGRVKLVSLEKKHYNVNAFL